MNDIETNWERMRVRYFSARLKKPLTNRGLKRLGKYE
jgi:hypothetical protein